MPFSRYVESGSTRMTSRCIDVRSCLVLAGMSTAMDAGLAGKRSPDTESGLGPLALREEEFAWWNPHDSHRSSTTPRSRLKQ